MSDAGPRLIHASCVALGGRGVLITGKSGSGKSGLALRLMALGAELVADDQVHIAALAGVVQATCPEALKGRIEARMLGILSVSSRAQTGITLVVDLDQSAPERLPKSREIDLCGIAVPLIAGRDVPNLDYAILQLIKGRLLDGRE